MAVVGADFGPQVARVFYPGLASHPQHALAKTQMKGFGGMISFDLGSLQAASSFLKRVRLCALAESLGGVESLIEQPMVMSYHDFNREQRLQLGIPDNMIRIACGRMTKRIFGSRRICVNSLVAMPRDLPFETGATA